MYAAVRRALLEKACSRRPFSSLKKQAIVFIKIYGVHTGSPACLVALEIRTQRLSHAWRKRL
jgi:hypothetical protein